MGFLLNRHIAILTTSFPFGEPGSEAAGSFVSDLAGALTEHLNVTVLAPCRYQGDGDYGSLRVRGFPVPYLPLSELKPCNPIHWPAIIQTLRSGQKEIKRLVTGEKVDHILALWALPSGYWARNVWKSHGIPYSTWALGSDIWSLENIAVVKGLLATVLEDSHTCFADGYRLKDDVERISRRSCQFLASVRKLPVKEKGLSGSPPYRLAFLGRWHPNKGVDILIESLNLLSSKDWSRIEEVRICGGGPLEKIVRSGCEALRRGGRPVTVGGYLNKEEAAELLAWADYLLLPSRIESIPVVFSDAMQAGCPVIASPVGDLPRLIGENKAGVLADNVSPTAFAATICSALKIQPKNFSDGLEQLSTKFSLQETVKRIQLLMSEQ